MDPWFVSTTRTLPAGSGQEVEWLLSEMATEDDAKAFASRALARGLRVEAGTLPGIEPKRRIARLAAHHWAQSSNEGAIMNLNKRLLEAIDKSSIARSADAKRLLSGTTR
jgi:hypothetical protein